MPNNLALPLEAQGVNILGTRPQNIDMAEDRNKFSSILDKIGVDQPEWGEVSNMNKAKEFCRRVGYPCLIRPSYVLSGAAMKVCFNDGDLTKFLQLACTVSGDNPVVISKFIEGAKEIEVDAVAHNGKVLNYAIGEHVENAGVHSGDATLILPAQKLFVETVLTRTRTRTRTRSLTRTRTRTRSLTRIRTRTRTLTRSAAPSGSRGRSRRSSTSRARSTCSCSPRRTTSR